MNTAMLLSAALWLLPHSSDAPQKPSSVQGPLADTISALRNASGDDKDVRPEAYFFEPSKVLLLPHVFQNAGSAPTGSQDHLVVEVEFNETIFPYQNRTSALDRHFGGTSFVVGLTPMYRVRIWREFSAPVRTPSFMPKGTLQLNYVGPRKPGRQWGARADGTRGFVPLTSLMLTVGHHSNGQDGCIFADATGTGYPIESCPTDPEAVRINRLNGSFSTNYLQVSAYRAFISVPKDATKQSVLRGQAGFWGDERRAAYAFFIGGTFEWNFPSDTAFGGAPEKAVQSIYGMNRFRLMGGYERYPDERPGRWQPRFKFAAWLQFVDKAQDSADCGLPGVSGLSGQPCAPRRGWGVDVNAGLGRSVDYLGVYARFYQVQDYYNLSFTHRKQNRLQVGLSFTPGRSRGPSFPTLETRVLDEERQFEDKWSAYKRCVRERTRHPDKACYGLTGP